MRILHYFLGFPPYRTGGLTKYSFDLMQEQVHQGNEVAALWPGKMQFLFNGKVKIQRKKNIAGIINYELINPLPVSLDEGILNTNAFTKECDKKVFLDFFKNLRPDAIHIHTLMGLYKEFVIAANDLEIKTIFTTHDYFGICPKVTLYKNGYVCDNDNNCIDCVACNQHALSMKKIKIMQSSLYRSIKNWKFVKYLRKKHRNTFFEENDCKNVISEMANIQEQAEKYKKLRQYYVDILSEVDVIHFNSKLTSEVYKKYIVPKTEKIFTITHKDISDNRNNVRTKSDIIRFIYLAPTKKYKGFNLIKEVLDDLWENGNRNFELKVFYPVQNPSPYMKIKEDGYVYEDLPGIMQDTDILLAPSIWYETFGFTVLEAISYGVPVIISENVGAKDIIGKGGIIIEAASVTLLRETINLLDKEMIEKMREEIRINVPIKSWRDFIDENYTLYR